MPQISYINGKPYFEVRPKGVAEPTLNLGEAGAAELVPVKDPTVIEKLDATSAEFEQQGIAPITDQNLINKLEGYEPIESTQGVGEKPPLLDQFKQAMTPPPEVTNMPLWKQLLMSQTMPLEAGAQMATGIFANTAGTVADRVMQMFGRSPEERQQIVQNIQQGLTYQPIDPRAAYINQVMAAPFSLATEATGEIPFVGGVAKQLLEDIFAVVPGKIGIANKPVGKTAPFTQQQLKARAVSDQYGGLPAYPGTLAESPKLGKVVDVFKNKVAPLFEKTHDVINDLINRVKEGYKTTDEQVQFLGEKGGLYTDIYSKLPKTFELPEFTTWLAKQIAKLEDLAQKQKNGLNKDQFSLLSYYQNLMDRGGIYDAAVISEINGKNPMSPNIRVSARYQVREGLKNVPGGEEVGNRIVEANKEYSLTSRSRIVTGFLDKVMKDGRIDPSRWNNLYTNFKLNNITRMKDVFENLDKVDEIVKAFGKELDAYNKYQKNPVPSKLENIMNKVAEYSLAAGGGGSILNLPGAGYGAALGAGMLGAQQVGKGIAKSAVKPEGIARNLMMKGEKGFEGLKEGTPGSQRVPSEATQTVSSQPSSPQINSSTDLPISQGSLLDVAKKGVKPAIAATVYGLMDEEDREKFAPLAIGSLALIQKRVSTRSNAPQETRTYKVSVQPEIMSKFKDKPSEVLIKDVATARQVNTNPERIADWQQIYTEAVDSGGNLGKWSDVKKVNKEGKLKDVPVVSLTKGCQRGVTTVERVENGILPNETRIESCFGGDCWVNDQFNRLFSSFENMEVRDLKIADATQIKSWLSNPKNKEWLNSGPFIRMGQQGCDSHTIASGLALEWLKQAKENGIKKKTVMISAGYAPVTSAQYAALAPYADMFELHFSNSGWFHKNEIMLRLAEYQEAKNAGLPAKIRLITNKDKIAGLDMPNEQFLVNKIKELKIPQDDILETPFHDDKMKGVKKRSDPTGEFKHICCETGICLTCGPKCMTQVPSKSASVATSFDIADKPSLSLKKKK